MKNLKLKKKQYQKLIYKLNTHFTPTIPPFKRHSDEKKGKNEQNRK